MRIPFFQKPLPASALYQKNPHKHSACKHGWRPAGFVETLHREGPDAVLAEWPWLATFDPYLAADVERERELRARRAEEERRYLAQQAQSNLKRQKARYGDSRWTHMKRCNLYDHDNICLDTPGVYRCQGHTLYGDRCTGQFEVTQRDAARMRNMRPEERVPYTSISDRYDYDALRAKNMARTKAMKY